jgi:hypothetical protein
MRRTLGESPQAFDASLMLRVWVAPAGAVEISVAVMAFLSVNVAVPDDDGRETCPDCTSFLAMQPLVDQ